MQSDNEGNTDEEDSSEERNRRRYMDEDDEDNRSDISSAPPEEEEEEVLLPPYLPAIEGCRNVDEFLCLNRIEEGTYGVVYRAKDKHTSKINAQVR